MTNGLPGAGNRRIAMILGFVLLVLGCAMAIAALTLDQMPTIGRVTLGGLGLFGAYWGMRFQRLSRRGRGD